MRRAALVPVMLGLGACFIPGFEVDGEASASGSTSASASTGLAPCESTPFPSPAPGGTGGALDLRFALYQIDFGETAIDIDAPKTDCTVPRERVGFDLDSRCSGCACTTGEPSCISQAAEACDGQRGIDNAIAEVIAPFSQSLDGLVGSAQLSDDAQAGAYVVLLRVWNYNGGPDDDQVSFAIYGGRPPSPSPPLWDGQDVYPVGGESVVSWNVAGAIERPTVKTSDAYVVGGRLIAVLEGDFPFGPGGLAFPFTSGRVEASLTKEGELWTLRDATVGARAEVRPFLDTTGELVRLGVALCRTAGVWGQFMRLACENRDLPPGAPGPVPCSSLSVGFHFEARPATFGPAVAPAMPAKVCYELPVDPCAAP